MKGDQFTRLCPECSEMLNRDARRCVCGWEAGARKGSKASGERWNHVCTWHFGTLTCSYPVGRFDQGMHSGWCVFHRAQGEGQQAARIAEESRGHTRESYLAAAKRLIYGDGSDNISVAKTRAALRPQPGNVGMMLPEYLKRQGREREPGADEDEAA